MLSRKHSIPITLLCIIQVFSLIQRIQSLHAETVVRDGFYKIINVNDGTVLTATRKGPRPYQVITDEWHDEVIQHWKVKSTIQGGLPLQIIRNEQIKDNELTKEANYEEGTGKNYIPLDWNFMPDPAKVENTFILFNGIGCLIGQGKGERIQITHCDESAPNSNELWKIEFLYKIPPQ